jgi:putative RecB family exonuclease
MALPQGYLSISQVRKYMTCPKQYQLKYVYGIQESKGSPLVVGSSFHKCIEESNRRKMETGEILSEDEMKEIYDEYWNKNVHSIDWKEDEDPEKEKDRGFSLAKIYMDEYGKHLDPVGFEAEFNVEVQGIPFKGYIDLIEKDGFIRDLKTTKKTPAKDIAEQSLQLAGYAFAYRELTGEKEKGCSLDYAISLKQPKVVRYETEITERRLDRFVDTFYNVTNAIDKEIFYRNEGPNCSWCSYKDLCRGE